MVRLLASWFVFALSVSFSFSRVIADDVSICYKECGEDAAVGKPFNPQAHECFLLCGVCSTPSLALGFDPIISSSLCVSPFKSSPSTLSLVTSALLNVSSLLHGFYFNEPGPETNATQCFQFLLSQMPRRDILQLIAPPHNFLLFMLQQVRWALFARLNTPWGPTIPWDLFLEDVLPYAVVDEPRDVVYDWRARYFQLFASSVAAQLNATTSSSPLAAARVLTTLIPVAAPNGVLSLSSSSSSSSSFVSGPVITWRSESSPGMLSPSQVGYFGGSCTGTAVVLVAAARAIGLAARLSGCSQSIPDDDHHWVEFWSPPITIKHYHHHHRSTVDNGPFGDGWHTREGVSAGNVDGPWDSPSTPMRTCLSELQPFSSLNTIWVSSWSSAWFLPTLWSSETVQTRTWAWKGGQNRCGAYCTAWGCGVNATDRWTQKECWTGEGIMELRKHKERASSSRASKTRSARDLS